MTADRQPEQKMRGENVVQIRTGNEEKGRIMKTTALILAGGKGERFWPGSRTSHPKQFLCLTGDGKTMIRHTVERILPIVDMEDIYVSTNERYRQLVYEQLPELPKENVICEPVGRNTAPGIGLGAVYMRRKYGDAVMLVLPSDHQIAYEDKYTEILKKAVETAEDGGEGERRLVTLGITPNAPETGYGYIKFDKASDTDGVCRVEKFVEKPDLENAKQYLASGDYLWNSGMFIWKVSAILASMEKNMPEVYKGLTDIEAAIGSGDEAAVLKSAFEAMPSQSVDYGILEKEDSIFVCPGDFGWDDVGSWLALSRLNAPDENGNVFMGNVESTSTKRTIVKAGDKLVAVVGLEDVVVVDTEDATLICSAEHTADIKKLLEELRSKGREEYL